MYLIIVNEIVSFYLDGEWCSCYCPFRFWDIVSFCISGWPRSQSVAQTGLELMFILPPTPWCWDYSVPALTAWESHFYSKTSLKIGLQILLSVPQRAVCFLSQSLSCHSPGWDISLLWPPCKLCLGPLIHPDSVAIHRKVCSYNFLKLDFLYVFSICLPTQLSCIFLTLL